MEYRTPRPTREAGRTPLRTFRDLVTRPGRADGLGADIRLALRQLRQDPGFATVALLVVGLGIGINAVVLSLADAVLLEPLPYPAADRLAVLTNDHSGSRTGGFGVSWANMRDVAERQRTLEGTALFLDWQDVHLQGDDGAHTVPASFVTQEYFELLGLETAVGRLLRPDENRENEAARVAVLGHGTWVRLFGSDPDVVGRTVRLSGLPYEVVGVLADDRGDLRYRWDQDPAGIFLPLFAAEDLVGFDLDARRGSRYLNALVRLRPGTSMEAAGADLTAISGRLADEYPEANRGWSFVVTSLSDAFYDELRTPLAVLLAGSLLVVLLVGANLATLLLARALGRQREMGVRRALGAARGRLMRQLTTESTVVAALGGVVGLVAAWWVVDTMRQAPPVALPAAVAVAMDLRVTLLSAVLVGGLGVLLGLGTAAAVVGKGSAAALAGGLRTTTSRGQRRLRSGLVVAEIALASFLLVGAGLMVESFRALRSTGYGFDTERLLLTRLEFRGDRYQADEQRRAVARALLDRSRSVPGVEEAFVWSPNRLGHGNQVELLVPAGRWDTNPEERLEASRHLLHPGTLSRVGIPLLEGRDVAPGDDESGVPVALVSRTLARELWPGGDAVGRRIESREAGEPMTWEVIGVVEDARHRTRLIDPFGPQRDVYFAFAQDPSPFMTLALRLDPGGDAAAVTRAVRGLVAEVDPDVPVDRVTTMAAEMRDEESRGRLTALLVGLYAALATALASLGVYGVLAQAVRRQRREIGVRMALGSEGRGELARLLSGGVRLAIAGAAVGLAAALLGGRLVESALYGVDPRHPWVFVGAGAVVVAVAALASFLPARRAASVDPADALRSG